MGGTQTLVFFAMSYAVSWALWAPAAMWSSNMTPAAVGALVVLGACGPTLAALVLTYLGGGRRDVRILLGRLFLWRVGLGLYAAVLVGIPAAGLLTVALHSLVGGPAVGFSPALPWFLLPIAFVVGLLGGPLNEEVGWRGYALPRLQERGGALSSSLLLGVVWGLWHLPLFFVAGAAQSRLPLLPYLAFVCALSVVFTWLYNSSGGSLLMPVLAHGAVNFTIGFLFPILPLGSDSTDGASQMPGAEGPLPFVIYASVACLAAAIVILWTGPGRLVRERGV